MVKCPKCGALLDLDVDEVEEGEILTCPDCAVDLEVVNTNPLEFDVVEPEEEGGEGDEEEPK